MVKARQPDLHEGRNDEVSGDLLALAQRLVDLDREAEEQIVALLKDKPMGPSALAEATRTKISTVNERLRRLSDTRPTRSPLAARRSFSGPLTGYGPLDSRTFLQGERRRALNGS
jgi:hypothetical protein